MPFLPDVIQIGSFPLDTTALTGLIGGLVAYLLAGWLARRAGAEPGGPQDVVLDLALGGIVAAKLVDLVLDPGGLLANPGTLLLFPHGPYVLPIGAVGGLLLVLWGLRRRSDRLAILDQAAAPLVLGLAVALAGWKAPGTWAFTPLMLVAGLITLATLRSATAPGHRMGYAVILASCALVLADLLRPGVGGFGGISPLQLTAAILGTGAWFATRPAKKQDPGT